jgi:deoxycytidylate deaminase
MIEEALKLAKRSSIRTHKTGCIIARGGEVLSTGWSHVPPMRARRSIHAEMHALARGRHINMNYATAYIATINGKSGNTVESRPCLECAIGLRAAGIHLATYTFYDSILSMIIDEELERHNLRVYNRVSDA